MKKIILLITAFAVFFCGRSFADPLEITIYLPRTASDLNSTTYSYDYIPLDAPIANTKGVDIVQNGPPGQSSSLFIRGTESDHSLITLNGVPIKDNSTPSGADDLSQHSLLGMNNIVVIKGPMSNVYGPNAAGGVVDMQTTTIGDNYVDFTIGSNNYVSKEISIVDKKFDDNHNFKLVLNQTTTDGISVYADGTEDDPLETNSYNFNWDYYSNKYVLTFNKIYDRNESNLDSSSADVLNYTGDWIWNNNQIIWQAEDTKVVLNNSTHDRTYNKNNVVDEYNSENNSYFVEHKFNKENYDYIIGWDYTESSADFATNINNYQSSVNENRYTTGAFFELDKMYSNGIISFSSRLDSISDFDNQVSSRIGGSYDNFRASYSQGYRLPTLYEMYGIDSYGYNGNPNLETEDLDSYEIGYRNNGFDVALFYIEESNPITYQSSTYVNVAEGGDSKGVEISYNKDYKGYFFNTSTTYTEAKLGNGNDKLRRPNWINNTSISKDIFKINMNYHGSHKDIDGTTYATVDKPSVTTFDFEVNKTIENKMLYFGLYNITDVNYERPDGYNQDGINFKAGIKIVM